MNIGIGEEYNIWRVIYMLLKFFMANMFFFKTLQGYVRYSTFFIFILRIACVVSKFLLYLINMLVIPLLNIK